MLTRLALATFASLTLFACSFDTPAPSSSGSSSKESRKDSDVTGGSAIDGTWDITFPASVPLAPSELTIQGDTLSGAIVFDDEGTTDSICGYIQKDRLNFELTVTGNRLAGTITAVRELKEPTCDSGETEKVSVVTGTRAKSKTGETILEGDWDIKLSTERKQMAFAFNVAGFVVKTWEAAKKSGAPVVTTTFDGDDATASSSMKELHYAARRR